MSQVDGPRRGGRRSCLVDLAQPLAPVGHDPRNERPGPVPRDVDRDLHTGHAASCRDGGRGVPRCSAGKSPEASRTLLVSLERAGGLVRVEAERHAGGQVVLTVSGDVDIYTSSVLDREVAAALGAVRPAVVVDLSRVEFMDSTGLRALVKGMTQARDLGGTLELVCPEGRTLRLFRMTGLDQVFSVHPTVADVLVGR
jgi:anti-sigma B factor antagonist